MNVDEIIAEAKLLAEDEPAELADLWIRFVNRSISHAAQFYDWTFGEQQLTLNTTANSQVLGLIPDDYGSIRNRPWYELDGDEVLLEWVPDHREIQRRFVTLTSTTQTPAPPQVVHPFNTTTLLVYPKPDGVYPISFRYTLDPEDVLAGVGASNGITQNLSTHLIWDVAARAFAYMRNLELFAFWDAKAKQELIHRKSEDMKAKGLFVGNDANLAPRSGANIHRKRHASTRYI